MKNFDWKTVKIWETFGTNNKRRRTESLKSRKNNIKLGGGKLKFSQLKATKNYNNSSKHHIKNKKIISG
jgi:hypothetical protein